MRWFRGKFQRRERGRVGERAAATHLRSKGYKILKKNWRNRFGEADLIARAPDGTLVLAEVKTGTPGQQPPESRVDRAKQRRLTTLGAQALRRFDPDGRVRFDVLAIELPPDTQPRAKPTIRHIQGAFESTV